mgnify:CR=1 FL=1
MQTVGALKTPGASTSPDFVLEATTHRAHQPSLLPYTPGNATLVMRLRQNVIRAGLRNISLAYARIRLVDAAHKLVRIDAPSPPSQLALQSNMSSTASM